MEDMVDVGIVDSSKVLLSKKVSDVFDPTG